MTSILLYWNHICVLHREEQRFLSVLTEKLAAKDILLEVRYFGLGYPEHMSEYLAKDDAKLPDIIVSADLEVFEDSRIFCKFQDKLYLAESWISLKESRNLNLVRRSPCLLPFTAIPLVYYTRERDFADTPLKDFKKLAFGGINNSAAKSIVKFVWERWGAEAADNLLAESLVTDMPIEAFQCVRQKRASTALVPSLYALRADGNETFLKVPQEGPLLIPSYLAALSPAPEWALREVAEGILCKELCDFYACNGDLLLFPACSKKESSLEHCHCSCPSPSFLSVLQPEEFYKLYNKRLPSSTGR